MLDPDRWTDPGGDDYHHGTHWALDLTVEHTDPDTSLLLGPRGEVLSVIEHRAPFGFQPSGSHAGA